MNNKITLGLDISTKTIGVCLAESVKIPAQKNIHKCKILELTHISPRVKPKPDNKLEELFKKVDIIKDFLSKYKDSKITNVVIEEPLLGSNNLYTSTILVKFNGMVSRVIYDLFDMVPEFLSSYESRKNAFPELMQPRKFNKKGEKILKLNNPVLFGNYDYNCDKKMIIWEKVNNLYPEIQWIYNKNNVLAKESFDMSDSVCVVLAYINLNN